MAPSPEKPENPALEEDIQKLLDHIRQAFQGLLELHKGRPCNEIEIAIIEIPFNILALIKNRTDLFNILQGLTMCLARRIMTPAMKEAIVVAIVNFVEQEPLLQTFMNIPLEDAPQIPLQHMYVTVRTKWLAQHEAAKKPKEVGGNGDGGRSSRSGGSGK